MARRLEEALLSWLNPPTPDLRIFYNPCCSKSNLFLFLVNGGLLLHVLTCIFNHKYSFKNKIIVKLRTFILFFLSRIYLCQVKLFPNRLNNDYQRFKKNERANFVCSGDKHFYTILVYYSEIPLTLKAGARVRGISDYSIKEACTSCNLKILLLIHAVTVFISFNSPYYLHN